MIITIGIKPKEALEMIFDDILRGAEGRFADGWRRMGSRLEANHGDLNRIASEQKRIAEELRESVRETNAAVRKRYEELDASIADGERSFEAHMLDVEKTFASLRAKRASKMERERPVGENSTAGRNIAMSDTKREGALHG